MILVRQRGHRDCGLAALATLGGWSYAHVLKTALALEPTWSPQRALTNTGVLEVAARLGLPLIPTRQYDPALDAGILRLRGNGWRHPWGHFVAIRQGVIACPQFVQRVPWRQYLEQHGARPCTLLRQVG